MIERPDPHACRRTRQGTCGPSRSSNGRPRHLARAGAAAARRLDPIQRRRRLRPSDLLDVRRRPDGGPDQQVPALRLRRARRPAQRPPHLLEGPRLAAALRHLQGGRRHQRRRDADLPQAGQPDRGPPHAGAAVGRRGHRVAGPGPADLGRRGLCRSLLRSDPVSGLDPVRRLGDGRGLDVGGVRGGGLPRPGQPDRHHRRQSAGPDRRDDARLGPGCLRQPGDRLRLARHRDRWT